jgi:hypothetical protein
LSSNNFCPIFVSKFINNGKKTSPLRLGN